MARENFEVAEANLQAGAEVEKMLITH
jgi:hypothetical protein